MSDPMEYAGLFDAHQVDPLLNPELFPELDLFSLEFQSHVVPFDFDFDIAIENGGGVPDSTPPQDDLLHSTWPDPTSTTFLIEPALEPGSPNTCSSGDSASSTPSSADEIAAAAPSAAQPPPKRKYTKRNPHKTVETVEGPVVPHGIIERRYRKKLDTHIDQLRAAVPTIRPGEYDSRGRSEGLAKGLKTTHKKNKAMVYAKAVEYIQHLEKMCLDT